jgi:Cu-processing system ATP-binding protein
MSEPVCIALSQEERRSLSPRSGRSVVEVSEVTKRFGRLTVLERVSLQIMPGRITALIGPNAAGKSTLIKAILGLIRPDTGRIVVNGIEVNGDPSYRAKVGYMPQAARFPENLTGQEVVAMLRGLRENQLEDDELFQEFRLAGELGKAVHTLSGGTRQKLNAALAFLFRPTLLILDEPTAGLDPVASEILREKIVRSRSNGATVILSSHVLADLDDLVDDIVFLSDGRVSYQGSLPKLKQATGQARLERAVAQLMNGERT